MKIRVRFRRNVLGRRAGTTDWVEATPMVETLVRIGSLKWLDAPKDFYDPEPEPVVEAQNETAPDRDVTDWDTAQDDGWPVDDESPSDG